jgi:guanylate kinase
MSGSLYVVSGPSGAGKGTLLERVLKRLKGVWLSISATTRSPRVGEQEGVQYFFLSNEEFDKQISVDGLLEWATVHGERYGTLRDKVEQHLEQGHDVILEIDPQGAFQVLERFPSAKLIFVSPPSLEVLEQRLRGRNTEDEASIARRLADAEEEMISSSRYHTVIVNDDLGVAAEKLYEYMCK